MRAAAGAATVNEEFPSRMVRKKSVSAPADVPERIEDIDVSDEMSGSFLEYAYSVIFSRALPDARDGLKPVQRRILFQMNEMGLRPDRAHVKSARVTGEVMGRLHPHGDSAIYDALVRMAQPFTLRMPLIDGHGNFGSLDDGPAAPRYTEARLAPAALAMVADIDENVVEFVPNYDNSYQQPAVLPAAIPNLLVNGASGIAVGMATNMAPHNLHEVAAGVRHLVENPHASLEDVMEFIPGPDLPSGGTITGLSGIRDAYATGRGAFKTRARTSIENVTARKSAIIVTELPYLVGPEKVIEKIKDGVQSKKLGGISDVADLTDREKGLRLVIGIKPGFSAQAVLEQLYRYTPLEDSFSMNNVALVGGQPQTLGLLDLLRVYIEHRIEVITRRTRFRLEKRLDRLHLVDGLLIAILDIDDVIAIIRSSDDSDEAKNRLKTAFDLSDVQAEYILELRLRRLTKFSRIELEKEKSELEAEIEKLRALLGSDERIRETVCDELDAMAEAHGTPRRTMLTEAAVLPKSNGKKAAISLEVADAPCLVALSATGRILRIDLPDAEQTVQRPARRSKHDGITSLVRTTTRTDLGAITSEGRIVRFSPVDLPASLPSSVHLAAGARIHDYLGLPNRKERVLAIVPLTEGTIVALGSASGVVKRVDAAEIGAKPEMELIALKPKDVLVGAVLAPDSTELVFVTDDAQLLRFAASTVRPQGRGAAGMTGMKIAPGHRAIGFFGISDAGESVVVTVTGSDDTLDGAESGSVKVSSLTEFPAKGRATGGMRAHRLLRGESALQLAWVGTAPARALGTDGSLRELPATLAKRDASGTALENRIGAIGAAIGEDTPAE